MYQNDIVPGLLEAIRKEIAKLLDDDKKLVKLRELLKSGSGDWQTKLSPINCTKFLDQSLPVDGSLEQLRFQDS